MFHIYWLILSLSITTDLLMFLGNRWRRIRGQVAQFSPQKQQELFLVVAVRGDILNVVVPVERCRCVASTAGRAQGSPSLPDCPSRLLLHPSVHWRHEHFPQFRRFDHFILDYVILGGNAPPAPPHSKCPHAQQQQGTVLAAFVAKMEQLVHGCLQI